MEEQKEVKPAESSPAQAKLPVESSPTQKQPSAENNPAQAKPAVQNQPKSSNSTLIIIIVIIVALIILGLCGYFGWKYVKSYISKKTASITSSNTASNSQTPTSTSTPSTPPSDSTATTAPAKTTVTSPKGGEMPINGYVIPASNSRIIAESEITSLTPWQLKVARNEIYARHGRKFVHQDLSCYFAAQNWYKIDPNYSEASLSYIENKNVATILDYEGKIASPFLQVDSGC